MPNRGHSNVNYIDMLITLDYLLTQTDEKHPAYVSRMCEYAHEKYNLTYTGGNKGDQVKRQRFSSCLAFLKKVYDDYPGSLPFTLKESKGGKYYIEDKYGLDEEELVKLLSTIKNDKYISNNDSEKMINKLLEVFTNSNIAPQYKQKIEEQSRGIKKVNPLARRRLAIVQQALTEERVIRVKTTRYLNRIHLKEKELYCRVYAIKDFNGKPYAILIGIKDGCVICDAIENIDIIENSSYEDFERDLNQEFVDNNPNKVHIYANLEELVNKTTIPVSYNFIRVSFSITSDHLVMIKNSFDSFFSKNLPFVEDGDKYAVKDLCVNKDAFISWLLSDPIGDAKTCILDLLDNVEPESLYRFVGLYYLSKLDKYKEYIGVKDIKTPLNKREHIKK